jgi:hypothetical protein
VIDLVANRREANRTKFSTPYLGPRTSSNNRATEKPGVPGIVLINMAGHQIKADANGIKISASQSCTGAFRYPTGSSIPVVDWFWDLHFFSFRYQTNQMPDSLAFRHFKRIDSDIHVLHG